MDLPQRVADDLGIERAQAERGLSALFTSIRMAVDPTLFSRVTAVLPDVDAWMRDIELPHGRTGEIVALAGHEGLARQLQRMDFSEPDAQRLGATVAKVLAEVLPKRVFQRIANRVPLLKARPQSATS